MNRSDSSVGARLDALLDDLPALPVLTIERAGDAVPLGQALLDAGLRAVEVTLRTPEALAAIETMTREVEGLIVGVGTVLTSADLDRAHAAGAAFAVSPGTTAALYEAATDHPLPLLPGVATATEIAVGLAAGWDRFKFFPAESSGGTAALKAFSGPFGGVRFCPTGGIGLSNAADYRSLANVMTVGGSWMAPSDAIRDRDWTRIETLARNCVERST